MKKILTTILIAVMAWMGSSMLMPTSVSAADNNCEAMFLTFRPWYSGLVHDDETCSFLKVGVEGSDEDYEIELSTFIWAIILNALSILFGIVGYLAIGFLIYGGYLYVMARGDPGRIAKGKNTVIRAIIGLIICILASLISSLIVNIITEATGA
ncbi:MAG: pilin [Candidatus Saccharimonadales bacterium]